MSVEAMTAVLHHSKATGTAKLVLLGIANHEGDGGAWPALRTLAKYAGLSGKPENQLRAVRRVLRQLEGMGELATNVQGGGLVDMAAWDRPNLYRVTVSCPPECDGTSAHRVPADAELDGEPELEEDEAQEQPVEERDTPGVVVDNPSAPPGHTTRGGSHNPGGEGYTTRGGRVEQPPEPSLNRPRNICGPSSAQPQDARAHEAEQSYRRSRGGTAGGAGAPPPTEELAKVRARLRVDAAKIKARDEGRATGGANTTDEHEGAQTA